jgi:hypothetical protein
MIRSSHHFLALKVPHLCEHHLNLLGNLTCDRPAPGYAIALNIIGHALRVRKIALGDRLALGAGKLFHKPLRHLVPAVHTSIEFVYPFIEGISASRHDGEQPDNPQVAIFDFTRLQAHCHHTRSERAAGLSHE